MTEENKTVDQKAIASLKYAKTVTVEGKDYTLQKLPVRAGLEVRQNCRTNGDIDDIKFYEQMLEHIVVAPKMKLDDFDDIGHLEKLMKEVMEYQYQGK